jgi:DNA-binding beta-propeller fold protein YncE
VSLLACGNNGAAALDGAVLAFFDVAGQLLEKRPLTGRGEGVARFGDEWLVLEGERKHLGRVSPDGASGPFAAGRGAIGVFAVGRDDTVAIARGTSLELWSRDDARRWTVKGASALTQIVVGRDHVVALGEDGALQFFAREDGEALGAVRLASTEPARSFRLAHVDAAVVVLSLGDWLVWIDGTTRKPIRRVRTRAKVVHLAADSDHVVLVAADGAVQTFLAKSGEPRATIEPLDGGIAAIALGAGTFFVMEDGGALSCHERQKLDVTARAAAPVTALSARGRIVVVGDRSGRVRVLSANADGLEESFAFGASEATIGISVTSREHIIAAGARLLTRFVPPRGPAGVSVSGSPQPRPVTFKTPLTAFAADDAYAFVGTQSGTVDVYELASGRAITTYELSEDARITSLLRLPGRILVVGTDALDGRVFFVDIEEAKVSHRVSPHEEAFGITCLATDARGRLVASGSDDGNVALVDPAKGRVLAKLRVGETPTALAFEPTGRRLACVFADGTAGLAAFSQKGATMADLGLRGVSGVAWADDLVFGFKDGHFESGQRHVRPSERPSARN